MDATLSGYQQEAVRLRVRLFDCDAFLLLLQVAALWNLWRWIGNRFVTSGDLSWELVPLISLAFFAWLSQPKETPRSKSIGLMLAAISLGIYAGSYLQAPPMFRAVIAMASLTFVISQWRFGTTFHPAVFTLLLLCLPVTDSLNFYLGYPMRVIVGEATAHLLSLQGLTVYREGVNLQFGDALVVIDAPCSGIKMLWFGILLATNLSFLFKLGARMFVPVLILTVAATILGNIARSSALFYIEGGLIGAPAWMHAAVGVVAFALTSLAIAFIVKRCSEVGWRK